MNAGGLVVLITGTVGLNIGGMYNSGCLDCQYMRISMVATGILGFIFCFVFVIALPLYVHSGKRANYQANLNALIAQQQQIKPQLQPQILMQTQMQQQPHQTAQAMSPQVIDQQQVAQMQMQQPQNIQIQPVRYNNVAFNPSPLPLYSTAVYPSISGFQQQQQLQQQSFGVNTTSSIYPRIPI
jgi:hypothetical protein